MSRIIGRGRYATAVYPLPRPPASGGVFSPTYLTSATPVEVADGGGVILTASHTSQTGRVAYWIRAWGFSGPNVFPFVPATAKQALQIEAILDGNIDVFGTAIFGWQPSDVLSNPLDPGMACSAFGEGNVPTGAPFNVDLELILSNENPADVFTISTMAIMVVDVPATP